jgi:hypothetical protein
MALFRMYRQPALANGMTNAVGDKRQHFDFGMR